MYRKNSYILFLCALICGIGGVPAYAEGPKIDLRVGGGLSIFVETTETPFGDYEGSWSGYGFLGGLGYAFWLGESFNLTMNVDHSRQFYSGDWGEPENSQFTIVYLGFDWY